jgi:recombination protein RecR
MAYPKALERLIENLSKLPGIGKKTATRLALFLLEAKVGYVEELAESIREVKERIRLCSSCFNITEEDPCRVCTDEKRMKGVICVVESPSHVLAIESANPGTFKYHVLHGLINPLEGIGPENLKIGQLKERVEREAIEEVVLAMSFNVEGNATAAYVAEILRPLPVKVTRISSGIPYGGDLLYADPITLKHSIQNRRSI